MSLFHVAIFLLLITFGILLVQGHVVCDIANRTKSCPKGYCCVRDELILEDVICRPYGKVDSICTTVYSESECPCLDGLTCKPMIESQDFTSVYGHCHNLTVDNLPTTKAPSTHIFHNHPPLIHLPTSNIYVSRHSEIGKSVTTFSVTDPDPGLAGQVNCYTISPPYFVTQKIEEHKFELVVVSSLKTFAPQILTVYVDCKDGSDHAANNIARFRIRITENEFIESTSTETVFTTDDSTVTAPSTQSGHNRPPLIHLPTAIIYVSRESEIGKSVTTFSVTDPDLGLAGLVNCYTTSSPYFGIQKTEEQKFELIVASSLKTFAPQILTVYVDCKDSSDHAANNIARFQIQITENNFIESTSTETVFTTDSNTITTADELSDSFTTEDTTVPVSL